MNTVQFNDIIEDQFDRCKKVLEKKGHLYSDGNDRLCQFKVTANLQGCSTPRAVGGKMSKHTSLLYDLINKSGKGLTHAQWNETLTDNINYLILLRAVLVEEGLLR